MYRGMPMDHVQNTEWAGPILQRYEKFRDFADFVQTEWNGLACGDALAQQRLLLAVKRALPLFDSITARTDIPPDTGSYYWERLIEDEDMHLGLLALPCGGHIPAHDHPNTIGLTIVLFGSPEIVEANADDPSSIIRKALKPGAFNFTFPVHNNIHAYVNLGAPAALLSINIQNRNLQTQKKRWHFSLHAMEKIRRNASSLVAGGLMAFSLLSFTAVQARTECVYAQAQAKLVNEEYSTAASMLQDCANQGLAAAQCKLGDLYFTGKGVQQDYYAAAQWYRKAAEQGDAQAQYVYGLMLVEGQGITDDASEGLEWIFRAMRAGHKEAKQAFEYLLANPAPLDC